MGRARIGIDGFNLAMPDGTGVASYGYALAEAVRAMDLGVEGVFGIPVGLKPELREVLFYEALERGIHERPMPAFLRPLVRWLATFRKAKVFEVPDTGRVEHRQFDERLPTFDRIVTAGNLFARAQRYFERTRRFYTLTIPNPPDIMHWTYPVPIKLAGARNIYTLHDLVPLKLPYATLDRKRVYHRTVDLIAREADHIVTVSESSRRDIIELLGVAPERVTNTYQAASTGVERAAADAGTLDAPRIFGLPSKGYFLFFGAIEPKKNVGRLLEAYLSSEIETPLAIVGARAWQSERELRLIEATGQGARSEFSKRIASRITRIDYLPRPLLLALVREARGVVFPSLYEGFGLPVLEAMRLGTPVVTSNTSSLPEIAGDAALLVDPYDVGAIADALRRIDRDPALRADLSVRGRAQAETFSSERYRAALKSVYSNVLRKEVT